MLMLLTHITNIGKMFEVTLDLDLDLDWLRRQDGYPLLPELTGTLRNSTELAELCGTRRNSAELGYEIPL